MSDYLRDILNQPVALRDTIAGLAGIDSARPFAARLASGELRRIVLTGMGSSFHALHPLCLKLIARGLTAQMIETSELNHYAPALLDSGTLVVAVSQSGQSIEIVQLLERNKAPLIGVTNTADSPLAKRADAVALTCAGSESTVSCKTYVATLSALAVLGEILSGQDTLPVLTELAAAPEAVERYLAGWETYAAQLRRQMTDIRHLIVVGRGPSLAAVGTAGLIIKEAAQFPTEGMSCAAFRHGPFELVSPELFVLVYSGSAPTRAINARMVIDVQAAGGKAALVAESPKSGPWELPAASECVRPILEILPAELLSVVLAQLRGHEAGRFQRAAKITTNE